MNRQPAMYLPFDVNRLFRKFEEKKGKTNNLPSGWYHTGANESGNRISYFPEKYQLCGDGLDCFFSCKAKIGFISLNKTLAKCSCHKKKSP